MIRIIEISRRQAACDFPAWCVIKPRTDWCAFLEIKPDPPPPHHQGSRSDFAYVHSICAAGAYLWPTLLQARESEEKQKNGRDVNSGTAN